MWTQPRSIFQASPPQISEFTDKAENNVERRKHYLDTKQFRRTEVQYLWSPSEVLALKYCPVSFSLSVTSWATRRKVILISPRPLGLIHSFKSGSFGGKSLVIAWILKRGNPIRYTMTILPVCNEPFNGDFFVVVSLSWMRLFIPLSPPRASDFGACWIKEKKTEKRAGRVWYFHQPPNYNDLWVTKQKQYQICVPHESVY